MSWSSPEGFVCSTISPRCWWGPGGQRGQGTPGAGAQGIPVGGTHRPDLAAARALPAPGEAANKSWSLGKANLPLPAAVWDELEGPFGGCVSLGIGVGEQQVLGWLLESCWGFSLRGVSLSGAGQGFAPASLEPCSTWLCQDLFGKDFHDSGLARFQDALV